MFQFSFRIRRKRDGIFHAEIFKKYQENKTGNVINATDTLADISDKLIIKMVIGTIIKQGTVKYSAQTVIQ